MRAYIVTLSQAKTYKRKSFEMSWKASYQDMKIDRGFELYP